MHCHHLDTIYALSTGALPSGVAVVRVSGAAAPSLLVELCGSMVEPRTAALRWIRDRNKSKIDQALVLWMPAPNSFTGEDCVEFHLHGGRAVVSALLTCIGQSEGTRHAEAGEFSRRAFENGKLDLVEIEGLGDLIRAETEMQRRLATQQADGGLSRLYRNWADTLTHSRALIEAELDFSDESDVPGSVANTVWARLELLAAEIRQHLSGSRATEIIRDGYNVVIAGPPNSGKSSLLNYLAKRDVAIVTDIAGTTRDLLSVELDLNGYLVRLVDTAGIRDSDDLVEKEGIRRSLASIRQADLVLVLNDGLLPEFALDTGQATEINVRTKSDLFESGGDLESGSSVISTVNGSGIDSLLKRIFNTLESKAKFQSSSLPARTRHVSLLEATLTELNASIEGADPGLEIRAECLRRASHHLGKITGSVDVEDLLGVIFSEFCVGK